ncbi:MAG: PepSY domain-containing protein [Anaerolineales bacterium]
MRKSTLFISTVLTMFMMATIFGVASAYQQIVKNRDAMAQTVATQPAVVQEVAVQQPAPVQSTVITPEQATTIATTFLNDTNVYSVETVDYQGVVAYLVTFSSGNLVYVDTTGQILAVSQIPPVVVVNNHKGNSGNDNNNNSSSTSHESSEEHEGGDD